MPRPFPPEPGSRLNLSSSSSSEAEQRRDAELHQPAWNRLADLGTDLILPIRKQANARIRTPSGIRNPDFVLRLGVETHVTASQRRIAEAPGRTPPGQRGKAAMSQGQPVGFGPRLCRTIRNGRGMSGYGFEALASSVQMNGAGLDQKPRNGLEAILVQPEKWDHRQRVPPVTGCVPAGSIAGTPGHCRTSR